MFTILKILYWKQEVTFENASVCKQTTELADWKICRAWPVLTFFHPNELVERSKTPSRNARNLSSIWWNKTLSLGPGVHSVFGRVTLGLERPLIDPMNLGPGPPLRG